MNHILITIVLVFCLFIGYIGYVYQRNRKVKRASSEKTRGSWKKKRRQQLLDKDRGKVLPFPENPAEKSAGKNSIKK